MALSLLWLVLPQCAISQTSSKLPGWCGQGYSGQAQSQTSSQAARQQALAEALAEISRQLGVTVSSEVSREIREYGQLGGDTKATLKTQMRSQPIEIKDYRILQDYSGPSQSGFEACIQVDISPAERMRLERIANGLIALTLQCEMSSGDRISCGSAALSGLEEGLTTAGYKLSSAEAAGYKVEARLVARFEAQVHQEYYAYADMHLKWISSEGGQVVKSASLRNIKGAAFSKADAISTAMQKAAEQFVNEKLPSLTLDMLKKGTTP